MNGIFWAVLLIFGLTACATASTVALESAPVASPTLLTKKQPISTPAKTTPTIAVTPTPFAKAGTISYHTLELAGQTKLEYALVLPEKFNPVHEYPILLALPPGGQTKDMVEVGLNNYWGTDALKRGWIVLSPIAPEGTLFFQGSESLIPEFLKFTAEQFHPEGGKYHLAGISNGGLSAFRLALSYPDKFQSLTVLPGFPPTEAEMKNLELLKDIPVAMFVGEQDSGWREAMEQAQQELTRLGGHATLEVQPGEGHILHSITAAELFEIFEAARKN
ncbi:MAG: alpha/beta hydrolase-fold protein [Anaerolineae bacterium]